jgi:hypothetical protein
MAPREAVGLVLVLIGVAIIVYAWRHFDRRRRERIIARGIEAMERLNKDLEKTGHKLEPVKQPDGTLQFAYKQIWSAQEIKRKERDGFGSSSRHHWP